VPELAGKKDALAMANRRMSAAAWPAIRARRPKRSSGR
jgi:hypothetical protein